MLPCGADLDFKLNIRYPVKRPSMQHTHPPRSLVVVGAGVFGRMLSRLASVLT